MKKHTGHFYRFLLVYAVFSLLMLSLYIPGYLYVESRNEENLLLRLQAQLEHGVSDLNRTISAMDNIVDLTTNEKSFRVFKYANPDDYIDLLQISNLPYLLSRMCTPHDLVVDAGLLFESGYIITRTASYTPATGHIFYEHFSCDTWPEAEWRDMIQVSSRTILPVAEYSSRKTGSYAAITYVSPWSKDGTRSVNCFFATLRLDAIANAMLDRTLSKEECYIQASLPNGVQLFALGTEPQGKHRILSSSADGNVRVDVSIPERVFSQQLTQVRRLLTLCSMALVAMAAVAVLLFAYRSSKPIDRFLGKAVSLLDHERPDHPSRCSGQADEKSRLPRIPRLSDDLNHLLGGIRDMRLSMENYAAAMEQNQQLVRAHIFDKAARQGLYAPEETALFASVFPNFPESYRLALMRFRISPSNAPGNTLIELLSRLDQTVYAQMLEPDTILMLLSGDASDEKTEVWMRSLLDSLAASIPVALSVAVGDACHGPEHLIKAYQQIQYVWCEPEDGNTLRMVSGKMLAQERIALPLSMLDLQAIYNALNLSNASAAETVLANCRNALFSNEENGMYCRQCYAMLANAIAQLKMENPTKLNAIVIPCYDHANRREIFSDAFPDCFRQICEVMKMTREDRVCDATEKILAYIDENLYNPDLYVDMVLERFSLSAPTLQKLVRNASGQTFSAYVETKRLTRAYEMLSNTEESVETVSRLCGFGSRNAFYKAFKRRFGIPPSDVPKKSEIGGENFT